MKDVDMKNLLETLVTMQKETAPIELGIGYVSKTNMVQHGCIVLKEAPPIVTTKLIENGYSLDITNQGVIVEKY